MKYHKVSFELKDEWQASVKKGMKALATNTLNTLPKLELAVILIYFKIFPNVVRPSKIPASNIVKLFFE